MPNENLHPSDRELLLLADGELPMHRTALVRKHLAACWDCRTRLAEIEGTIGELMRMHHQTLDREVPPSAGQRARLKAQLAELVQSAHPGLWQRVRLAFGTRAISVAGALALAALLGAILLCRQPIHAWYDALVHAAPLPDPHLTPGATAVVATTDICSTNHDDVVRAVPSALQQTVFQEYGIREARAANYEIDFLISPGLGGTENIRNLWPQPRYNTVWNSFVKDQLEDYLHRSVCGGRISLLTAQRDIAADWISAYKKYFHTDRPRI